LMDIRENNLVLNIFQTEVIDDDKFLSIINYMNTKMYF
jgi:hypothetical protein